MAKTKDQDLPQTHTQNPKSSRLCYGLLCCLGTTVTIIIILVILGFTVFKVKDPEMTLNKIHLGTGNTGLLLGSNITMTVDSSVKNPNLEDFKFRNTTTNIFYRGILVGQGNGPPGNARARKSMRMNITSTITTQKVVSAKSATSDIVSGLFTMDSYTEAPGKVKVIVVKKNVVVKMNSTVTFNITSQEIKDQQCKSHVLF